MLSSGVLDRYVDVATTVLKLLGQNDEDDLVVMCFERLDAFNKDNFHVAKLAIEAYVRLGQWNDVASVARDMELSYNRLKKIDINKLKQIHSWQAIAADKMSSEVM